MPLIDTSKGDPKAFTPEEQAELDAAEQENVPVESEQPEEAAEPAPKANGKAQDAAPEAAKPGKPPNGFVPQSALHEARREAQEFRERLARVEGMWQRLQQERTPQQQQQQVPEFDQDPIGHLRAQLTQSQRELQEIKGHHQQRTQAEQQQAQVGEVMNRYAQAETAYMRENRDYNEARDWLAQSFDAELQARGFDDPAERTALLQREEGFMVGRALQTGKNPAELIYNLAKHRGWKKQEAQPAEAKIERLQKGAKASASLSSAKGSPQDNEGSLSLEALANLDGAEFDRAWERMQKRGLLG